MVAHTLSCDYGNSSFSSFTVDNGDSKFLDQQVCFVEVDYSPQRRRTFQKLRFEESLNQIHECLGRTVEDCHELWYTGDDYDRMRANRAETIQELRKMDNKQALDNKRSFSSILEDMLGLVSSLNYVVEDATSIMNAKIQKKLSQLYRLDDDISLELIGLEPHIQGELRRVAREHRGQVQDVVYEIQEEKRRGLWSDDKIHDELRDSCLCYSQAFGLLAQLLARAQVLA
ncbi:hypothetical protein ACA910_021233 [Epithemia clementina (nom. ined.)]